MCCAYRKKSEIFGWKQSKWFSLHLYVYAKAIAPSFKPFNQSVVSQNLVRGFPQLFPHIRSRGLDFRPISLLSTLSKVLEWHFHILISEHLWTHCRCPATENYSISSAECDTWLASYLVGSHGICAVFPLLSNLQKTTWIQNYLTERYQKVVVNGKTSHSVHVTSGVPQVSILGNLLFLIILWYLQYERSQLVLYADDMPFYHPISNSNVYSVLQSDIKLIGNRTSTDGMSFNINKCKCMTTSRKWNSPL